VHNFHLRYVRIAETKIRQTTYTYKFDESMRSFFLQALDHSEDWTADRLPKNPEQPQPPPKRLSTQPPATDAQKEAYFASGWRAPVRSSVARADGTYPPLRPVDTALHAIVDDDGVGDDEAPGEKRAAVAALFHEEKRRAPAGPVLSTEDQLKEARADWDAAKVHAPPSTAATMLARIAFLSMHLNLYEDALKAAEEAIDKDSSNIRAYAAASAALTSLGRRKKQAQAWDKIKNALMEQAQEEEF
jgi:tetratricopeptide (TPR) repeat protein